jgi:uncharacterized protein (DUF2147 family)
MRLKSGAALVAAIAALGMSAPAFASDPSGMYHRKNNDLVQVWITDGKLYCRIMQGSKPNFEMCHGMTLSGDEWTGKHMKHPSMPGFMTFNGTVTTDSDTIKIKGCAMGKSFCDSESWTRVPPKGA